MTLRKPGWAAGYVGRRLTYPAATSFLKPIPGGVAAGVATGQLRQSSSATFRRKTIVVNRKATDRRAHRVMELNGRCYGLDLRFYA
ncbi:hypothetical protein FAES_4945 [Fibrella aestuarina BUZ 2]|uniref:Uncharacterized protein n=1 Tax=Fibrella aestuarina BUZ 2 TaxID=1166018 RepID=I0KFP1_9BACT|nr:hypothetical protein FAES_4945 [Fibrella aestuarina BUZ 2]